MEYTSTPKSSDSRFTNPIDTRILDGIFKILLMRLDRLLLKIKDNETFRLIGKWMKIFGGIFPDEKYARDCLLILMMDQLYKNSKLKQPFTEINGSLVNLNVILNNLNEENLKMVRGIFEELAINLAGQDITTIVRHLEKENSCDSIISNLCDGSTLNLSHAKSIIALSLSNQPNPIMMQNTRLLKDIETLRHKLAEKTIENLHLTSKLAQSQLCHKKLAEQKIEVMKKRLLDTIESYLGYQRGKEKEALNLFQSILGIYSNDEAVVERINQFDKALDELMKERARILIQEAESSIIQRTCEREHHKRQELMEQFQSGLKMQSWAQRLEVQLVSLKLISEIRDIILKYSSEVDCNSILNALQELEFRIEADQV